MLSSRACAAWGSALGLAPCGVPFWSRRDRGSSLVYVGSQMSGHRLLEGLFRHPPALGCLPPTVTSALEGGLWSLQY